MSRARVRSEVRVREEITKRCCFNKRSTAEKV